MSPKFTLSTEEQKQTNKQKTPQKMHNLKVVGYVLLGDLTDDYSLGNSLSDSSEGLF